MKKLRINNPKAITTSTTHAENVKLTRGLNMYCRLLLPLTGCCCEEWTTTLGGSRLAFTLTSAGTDLLLVNVDEEDIFSRVCRGQSDHKRVRTMMAVSHGYSREFAVSVNDDDQKSSPPVSTGPSSTLQQWSPATITLDSDDLHGLKTLFSHHFPARCIAELTHHVNPIIALTFTTNVEIQDAVDMTPATASEIFATVMHQVLLHLSPELKSAIELDSGFRVSYFWDLPIKHFSLHVIAPNTYIHGNTLYEALRNVRFTSLPLSRSYTSCWLEGNVLTCTKAVALYLGPSYIVIKGSSTQYIITDTPPHHRSKKSVGTASVSERQHHRTLVVERPAGLPVGDSGYGKTPVWLRPVAYTVEFFVRMIQRKTREYDALCNDVVYTECATMSPDAIIAIIGQPPRVGRQNRSVRFLYWIAKRVCYEEYKRWMFEQAAIIAHQFTHEAVTDEIFQRLFLLSVEGDFMSVHDGDPNGEPILYYFKNIWHVDKKKHHLKQAISSLVTTFLGRELRGYMEATGQADIFSGMEAEVMRLNYMTSMRNHTVNAISAMLCEDVRMDEDPNLLGCTNVVIELSDTGATHRPGRPEDLVSMSTNIFYREYSDQECEDVQMLYRRLFPDDEMRVWYLRLMCGLLQGTNPERSFYMPIGCARNGKSQHLNLLELIFGDYFGRFSSKAMCERRDPSSTSPELNTFHGKRVVACSELKAGDDFEADIIKALVGDDRVSVRGLHKDPRVLRMMARIFIATNHFPRFINADKALRDRFVPIIMESVFDEVGAPTDEFEQFKQGHFPADRNFRRTMEVLAPKQLHMMVKGFAEYKRLGLNPKPRKVTAMADAYWHEACIQSRFIADCLTFADKPQVTTTEDDAKPARISITSAEEASGNSSSLMMPPPPSSTPAPECRPKLTVTQAYDRFTAWAAARAIDISKYPRFTFKSLMDSELAAHRAHRIEIVPDGWIGVKLNTQ